MRFKKAFIAVAATGLVGVGGAAGYGADEFYHAHSATQEGVVTFDVAFSPRQGATNLVVKTIGEAKESLHLAAYSFTSQPIADALVADHDRGVDVEVVLDKSQRGGKMAEYVEAHGIPTRINDKYAIMHDKFMVIDRSTVELGSFNFTAAAEKSNAENVLVIHGSAKEAKDYETQWQKLWAEAKPPSSFVKGPKIS
jgi:phosphatidylserine/phosphatidylglycerophosphate/cardiolipin synthase-like enzyme